MLARCLPLCLLACVSCLAAAESAPEETTTGAPAPFSPEPGPPYDANAGYKDPCIYGEIVEIQGRQLAVPIPCARSSYDTSDPPPYERVDPEQREREPEEAIAAPDQASAPIIRLERSQR